MAYDTPDIVIGDEAYLQAKDHRVRPLVEGLAIGGLIFVAVLTVTLFIYQHSLHALSTEIQNGLRRTAATVAQFIDGDLHHRLTDTAQQDTPEYFAAVEPLAKTVASDPTIAFAYTLVLRDGTVFFVLDPTAAGDADGDGVEDKSYILEPYENPTEAMLHALRAGESTVETQVHTDQWGTFLTGYAPFFNAGGDLVGVVGLDITADDYVARLEPIRRATIRAIVTGLFVGFLVGSIIWFVRNFTLQINRKRMQALRHFQNEPPRQQETVG